MDSPLKAEPDEERKGISGWSCDRRKRHEKDRHQNGGLKSHMAAGFVLLFWKLERGGLHNVPLGVVFGPSDDKAL